MKKFIIIATICIPFSVSAGDPTESDQPLTIDLTGIIERKLEENVKEAAEEHIPHNEGIPEIDDGMSEAPTIDLDIGRFSIDLDLDAISLDADRLERMALMNSSGFQPDGNIPELTRTTAIPIMLFSDPERASMDVLVDLRLLETSPDGCMNRANVLPSQRRSLMEEAADGLSVSALVVTTHDISKPVFDTERMTYSFPSETLNSASILPQTGARCGAGTSGARGVSYIANNARYITPIDLRPALINDISVADNFERQTVHARNIVARVVSEPVAVRSTGDVFTPTIRPLRVHFYASLDPARTSDGRRINTLNGYLFSYDIATEDWYMDLPEISEDTGRIVGRERIEF